MRLSHYDLLAELVEQLRGKELKAGMEYVRRFQHQNRRSGSLPELLEKLREDVELNSDSFYEKHYAKRISRKAFFQNCRRLRKRLLESLLMEPVTEDPESFSLASRIKLRVNKDILSSRILISRGCIRNAFDLLEKSVRDAKRMELYDELIEALTVERNIKGTRYGKEVFYAYDDEIAFYEDCQKASKRALDRYHRFFIEYEDFTGSNNKKVAFLTESLSQLEADLEHTGSDRVKEALYKMKILYYNAVDDPERSCRTGEVLLETVRESPALHTPVKEADISQDIADNKLLVGELSTVEEFLEAPLSVYPEGDYDHLQTLEILFLKHYYAGELEKAVKVLEERMIPSTDPENTPFLANKWEYFRAVLAFVQGEPKRTLRMLDRIELLDTDKESWNLWIRFLGIMAAMEADAPELAEHRSENVRKDMERILARGGDPFPRERVILRLLRTLELFEQDAELLWQEKKEELALLASGRWGYRWEARTPELVIFPDWVKARARGESYRFRFPRPGRQELLHGSEAEA